QTNLVFIAMQLLRLIVPLTVTVVVVCSTHLEPDSQHQTITNSERRSCKTKDSCAIRGSVCQDKSKYCKGRMVNAWCGGRDCQCCIPECPTSDGFFKMSAPSSQCYKFFNDRARNWAEANTLCEGEKLRLAQPSDARTLRSYMTQHFGWWSYAWLNARGDGTQFRWQGGNKKPITENSPLWWPGFPGTRVNSSFCLILAANEHNWKAMPEHPYTATPCSADRYTLCELVFE
ncbi:unnamed protein product, partial [Meganyctiphanes norvegica]